MLQRQDKYEKWIELHRDSSARADFDSALKDAWSRSDKLNIDEGRALPRELTSGEFERAKRSCKRLMTCSDWVINHMIANAGDTDLRVLLFSSDGVLLRVYGETSGESDWLREQGVKSGTRWSEDSIGANIFSMGLKNRGCTELQGYMNYSRFLVGGAYCYAPVYLTESDVPAGLVVAVPAENSDKYLRTVAVTAARSVELDMFMFRSIEMFTSDNENNGSIFVRIDDGKYRVGLITDQVFKILGIKKTDSYHLTLEELILPPPENKEFWNIVSSRKTVTDKTLPLSVIGGRRYVTISTNTYKQNKFHPDGYTIFISPSNAGNKAPRYTDNNARFTFSDIIGENELLLETVKRSQIAALSDSNILIQGESGVGKDVFAQAIHNASNRSHKPFVAINCAAFSKELISSELFGYESGAFTGARREGSIGKFELANHGTLFMDEIGDMPMEVQSVLLRVLEEKTFRKVGGNKLIEVDVRIIAATNKNLKELIEQKLFREDLFYRLSVIRINIPPLRNRGEDVYLFAQLFIKKLCDRMGKPEIKLTKGALEFLGRYSWPGNIRELQNLLEGIISTHEETTIGEQEISTYLGDYFRETKASEERPSTGSSFDIYSIDEKEKMELALKKCRNNKTKAAEYLGLSRSTFYRRMQEFGLK